MVIATELRNPGGGHAEPRILRGGDLALAVLSNKADTNPYLLRLVRPASRIIP